MLTVSLPNAGQEVYYYAASKTWNTTFPDGAQLFYLAHGQVCTFHQKITAASVVAVDSFAGVKILLLGLCTPTTTKDAVLIQHCSCMSPRAICLRRWSCTTHLEPWRWCTPMEQSASQTLRGARWRSLSCQRGRGCLCPACPDQYSADHARAAAA